MLNFCGAYWQQISAWFIGLDVTLTQFQSGSPAVSASADSAAVDQISNTVWNYQRTTDVVKLLFSLLDCGCVVEAHVGRRVGGPGELRFRVDLLWAAGDPVFYLLNVDFTDWNWKK